MHLFQSHHVKLLNSCYPPSSVLLTAGPDYSPNSHELSRLTYYASNHPGKLAKISTDLEKRLKGECLKANAGNIRSRASLLISLAIFRSLVTECRRDIALLSSSLIASVESALASVHSDLEVLARAASVFTAWATFTTGQLIGADSSLAKTYLSILSQFAKLGSIDLPDQETQNRTRLIGLAALTATVNSAALHNDIGHFGAQVSIILHPILSILFATPIPTLDEQAFIVKDSPDSPYLAEFRTRPALERRAASIHVHIDGDNGPSSSDVSDACLRALFSLFGHANGTQLGYIMQSSFDNLEAIQGWLKPSHCCWYAQKTAEWARYQYRYVVPTWLVERLISQRDITDTPPLSKSIIAMVTSIFSSRTPLINLSSSDILSNLLSLLMRRVTLSAEDILLPSLVDCISSLGRHVYYSDQIQDLSGELIGRLVVIEVQGISIKDQSKAMQSRSSAIQSILKAAVGLFRAAQANDSTSLLEDTEPSSFSFRKGVNVSNEPPRKERKGDERSRRTRISPDMWQDSLSLLCDSDPSVRRECSGALVSYIIEEMPKYGESTDNDGKAQLRRFADSSFRNVVKSAPAGDAATRFLNIAHAYLYILATSPTLGLLDMRTSPAMGSSDRNSPNQPFDDDAPTKSVGDTTSEYDDIHSTRRTSSHGSKALKHSLILKLAAIAPSHYADSIQASEEDYASIMKILSVIQTQFPMRGIITGVPMLIALDKASSPKGGESYLMHRIIAMKTILSHVWLTIAQVWNVSSLATLAEKEIKSLSSLPNSSLTIENLNPSLGLRTNDALNLLSSSQNVLDALGVDKEGFMRRISTKWTPDLALRDFENAPGLDTVLRSDGMSPLLKISPALMQIENISLQSLVRSTRGLGVTDLREALEGRSMSNPNLAGAPSISTSVDHTSSVFTGDLGLRLTRTKSRAKKVSTPNSTGEVREVLTRLGIGKQNSNLLKTTFPLRNKPSTST